jgi:DNA recombination protein RmuC
LYESFGYIISENDLMNLTVLVWAIGASVVTGVVCTLSSFFRSRHLREQLRQRDLDLSTADVTIDEQRVEFAVATRELQVAREENVRLTERLAQQELRIQEQLAAYRGAEQQLIGTFKALASDVLKSNTEQFSHHFSETARALLEQLGGSSRMQVEHGQKLLQSIGAAIAEKISEVDKSVKEIEKTRISTDAELKKQLEVITAQSERVGLEAARLHSALTNNRVQGEWGQIQLRNLVERAGMLEYCDFDEQVSEASESGRLRPDLVVHLPNQFRVIVDAKAPTKGFSEALREPDAKLQKAKLKEVADAIRRHVRDMAARDYPSQFAPALEYTLVFLPNESVFYGALSADPEILSFAEERKVIITTPLSLLAFLRTVACGWTQVRIQENAREIQQLGKEMHRRMQRFMASFAKVGKGLDTAVRSFNDAVGTSRNVGVSLRRFQELGAGDGTDPIGIEEIAEATRIIEQESELSYQGR